MEEEMELQHMLATTFDPSSHKRRHHSCEKYMFLEIRDHKYHKYLSLHKCLNFLVPDL
jgi:hypothetical protein